MKHKLEVSGIVLEFGTKKVLSDTYFECTTGQVVGILGKNGQGKSCLMNVVYGSLNALGKSIRFDDVTISHSFKRPDLLTYLPQFNFIPPLVSLKRIFSDFGLNYEHFSSFFPEFKAKAHLRIKNLSGGQRRLVEVYVIIMSKSKFSMLDEPFSHLMPLQIEKIKEILQETKQSKGFIITDHMFQHVTEICNDVYILANGKTHLTKDITDIEKLGYARL